MLGCHGGNTCCTPDNKCGEDEGDCDTDNDCQDGLKCGEDNCSNKGNGNPNNEWNAEDDCCYKPGKMNVVLNYFFLKSINIRQSFFAYKFEM